MRLLDAASFGRTAAVVRDRGLVLDGIDLQTDRLKRADRGLTAGAGALDDHVDFTKAVILSRLGSLLRSHLRGKRRGLASALETDVAAGSPGQQRAAFIGDADDGVVERREDMSHTVADILLFLFTR